MAFTSNFGQLSVKNTFDTRILQKLIDSKLFYQLG